MAVINKIQLLNASRDADDLGAIVNGGIATTVHTRYGPDVDSVAKAIQSIRSFNYRGAWATATAYALKDVVTVSGISYVAVIGHTSGGSFATDLAAGKWVIHQGLTREEMLADDGSNLVTFIQGGDAEPRSLQAKVREIAVSITDFGAVADTDTDSTNALHAAIDYLGAGGGIVEIPFGNWKMNAVIAQHNLTIRGQGGRAEFDLACIRPFDLTKPVLTFGDDLVEYRDCGIERLHLSGTDGFAGEPDGMGGWVDPPAYAVAARNAPQTLLLKGGTVNFSALYCVFNCGIQTLALVPSEDPAPGNIGKPVSGCKFIGCTIRNDIADSANARGIYNIRRADGDGGYSTSNKFIATKLNGPTMGYAAEFDGSALGITVEVNDCYWDVKPGKGVLLKGGTGIVCNNFQLDPGTTGVVVIETDQAQADPSRFINGSMRHGGQKIKFAGGALLSLPPEADFFAYKGHGSNFSLSGPTFFTEDDMPYGDDLYLQRNGDNLTLGMPSGGALVVPDISSNTGYRVGGQRVLSARGLAVADATDAASVITQLNLLLDRMRDHGLIAS